MTRTARISMRIDELRARLDDLQHTRESSSPIKEVAIEAVQQELTRLGRTLSERMRRKL